jgi:hypothetical protein
MWDVLGMIGDGEIIQMDGGGNNAVDGAASALQQFVANSAINRMSGGTAEMDAFLARLRASIGESPIEAMQAQTKAEFLANFNAAVATLNALREQYGDVFSFAVTGLDPNSGLIAGAAPGSGGTTTAAGNGLTMTVVQAPTQLSDGKYVYKVQLGVPAGQSGHVVQHVVFTTNMTDAKGNPTTAGWPSVDFYEAWKVTNGEFTTSSGIDTFQTPVSPAGAKGTIMINGRITFIPDYTLNPKDGWSPTAVPYSGGLPATTQTPTGWPTSGTQTHILLVRFDNTTTPPTSSAKAAPGGGG